MVRARYGRLDVLVNNAGIFLLRHIDETTEGEWDRVMAVNAKSVFLGTKLAVPLMREQGRGSIINISSASGITGAPSKAPTRPPRARCGSLPNRPHSDLLGTGYA